MKGIFSSLIVLLIFITSLFLASAFSTKTSQYTEIVNSNNILDRVYNKFSAIEYGIKRILEEGSSFGGIKVAVKEGAFNLVSLTEILPSDVSSFKTDMGNFKTFVETKANETNFVIDLNFSLIEDCLPLTILPYDISYNHPDRSKCLQGQQDLRIIPGNNWSLVNGYSMVFVVNSSMDSGSSVWSPSKDCSNGDLIWNITVIGTNGQYGPDLRKIKSDGKCIFRVSDKSKPSNKILQVENDPNNVLNVIVQPNFKITSTLTLNLTKISGGIKVGLPSNAIKIKETLYNIEKNDTVNIYG